MKHSRLRYTYSPHNSGLYIHIPFCVSKCTYCDFFSVPHTDANTRQKYGQKIIELLDKSFSSLKETSLKSVYIGGGSPSTMDKEWYTELSSLLKSHNIDLSSIEFSVEANPSDITPIFLKTIKKAGVNRLSVGIQALDSTVLQIMGRRYQIDDLKEVLPICKNTFNNLSYDIIYGIKNNSRKIRQELETLFYIAEPTHLSAYSYTVPEHDFAPQPADDETVIREEEEIQQFLIKYGFNQYEISNYSLPGKECRHNLLYWSWETYLGIGSAAHSFFPDYHERFFYDEDIQYFIHSPSPIRTRLMPDELVKEFIMLSLRKTEGFSRHYFKKIFGDDPLKVLNKDLVDKFVSQGFLKKSAHYIWVTPKGRSILNDIILALFEDITISMDVTLDNW